jgi:hypothetical protein
LWRLHSQIALNIPLGWWWGKRDMSAVNIEALRLHLVEMQDMTLNVNVVQQPINFGFQAVITPTTKRALQSMNRILSAHPNQMKEKTGWDMLVTDNNDIFTIEVTSNQLQDVDKIRGLGYIGIMAYGNHHQPHHWAMAYNEFKRNTKQLYKPI